MNTPINEIAARLNVLEFVVEIILANQCSFDPLESSALLKENLIERLKTPDLGPMPLTSQQEAAEAWIANRTADFGRTFVEKVAARELGIRIAREIDAANTVR